jgi:nitrous oxidase accessory protein
MRSILLISACFCFCGVSAKHMYVGRQQQYKSIRAALAVAGNGDTISVQKGMYYEKNLVITKRVYLRGIGNPILDGEKKYEIISIKADGVTIDGFTLQNTGISSMNDFAAVKIYNSRDVSVINNMIRDAFFGIYIQYGVNCLLRDNILTAQKKDEQQSGNGIHCWKSDSIRIIANTISGHRDGIYFEFVTHSLIWRNYSSGNLRYGLHFMFSNEDTYVANVFEDNGAGVAVMFSKTVKMFGNHFRRNWGESAYGILMKEISDSYLEGNYFSLNSIAVYAEGASRISIKRNLFKENGWGLKIQASCMDLDITGNDFMQNTFDVATNGSLVMNRFNKNYWDKYEGYDLDRNGIGDVAYRPVSVYSMIVEQNPTAMLLFRSFMTSLLDKTEKVLPSLIPEDLKDDTPVMKPMLK